MTLVLAASKSTALVDWSGLFKVLWISALFVFGIVVIVSAGITLLARAESSNGSRRSASTIGAGICGLLVLGAIVFGLIVLFAK